MRCLHCCLPGITLLVLLLGFSAVWAGPFDESPLRPGASPAASGEEAPGPVPTVSEGALPTDPHDRDAVIAKEPAGSSSGTGLFARVKGFFGKSRDKLFDWKKRLTELWSEGISLWKKVRNIPGWFHQGKMSKDDRETLEALAKAQPQPAWPAGGSWLDARNAHLTNTRDELKAALAGDYNWLESDIRLEGPLRNRLSLPLGERRPIVAHDEFQTNGMLFSDWLSVVKDSGRGLKLDFKQSAALDEVLKQLTAAGIPDYRLILNIGLPAPAPGADLEKPPTDPRTTKIRAAFPQATINLSPAGKDLTDGHYSEREIQQMIRHAQHAGPPVMFPLRAEQVTREVVQALRPFGQVAIWNSFYTFNPVDVDAEIGKFRSWGVDGMIDIRTKEP